MSPTRRTGGTCNWFEMLYLFIIILACFLCTYRREYEARLFYITNSVSDLNTQKVYPSFHNQRLRCCSLLQFLLRFFLVLLLKVFYAQKLGPLFLLLGGVKMEDEYLRRLYDLRYVLDAVSLYKKRVKKGLTTTKAG